MKKDYPELSAKIEKAMNYFIDEELYIQVVIELYLH